MRLSPVINVSNIISSMCYSLFRAEPYLICPYKCVYCYRRWYLNEFVQNSSPLRGNINAIINIVKCIVKRRLKPYPARLSTLTEPFSTLESMYKLSLYFLKEAFKLKYPIIVNTKSSLPLEKLWLNILENLSHYSLIVFQISLSTLKDDIARKIEPHAPTPKNRVTTAAKLSEKGVPVILRLSPLIPKMVLNELDEIVDTAVHIGVKHVVVEALRLQPNEFKRLYSILKLNAEETESYSLVGEYRLVKPSRKVLFPIYSELQRKLVKNGIGCFRFSDAFKYF